MNILLVERAHKYSPNSVERDAAILQAVADELEARGHCVAFTKEDQPPTSCNADVILTMGRDETTLRWLAEKEENGIRVENSARAMLTISRRLLLTEAQRLGIATPPFAISPVEKCPLPYPVWWKRDDRVSQEREDVVLVHNEAEWQAVCKRGIGEFVVEKHIEGDLVKFYSVVGTDFFHWNYPEFSKFGNETNNDAIRGFCFDADNLKRQADRLAQTVGLSIYGGDAIVTEDGTPHLIDLNDWPSFSSCREKAAKAIASTIYNS